MSQVQLPNLLDTKDSEVCRQLRGKQVLITGTTGYVGKIVLEKLMRAVPDIGGIHLLIRGNSKHPNARDRFVNEIACSSVFESMKLDNGDAFDHFCAEKIHCVTGEVTEPFFGLPKAQFDALAEQVDAVVNSAASVNFREELDVALRINTLSLRNVVEFSRAGGDTSIVQISTCYVNGFNSGHMREEIVRPTSGLIPRSEAGYYDVDDLIGLLQDKIADVRSRYGADQLSERLTELGSREARHYGWSDVYTFTKWMGEQLLLKQRRGATLTILRPSIVESTLNEPAEGWIEGVKVADALILAYARGKLNFFPANRAGTVDIIPGDLVGNSIILSLAETFADPGKHRIYQCCSGSSNPLNIGRFIDLVIEEGHKNYQKYDRLFYKQPAAHFRAVNKKVFNAMLQSVKGPMSLIDKGLKALGGKGFGPAMDKFETLVKLSVIFSFYTSPTYIFHNEKLTMMAERFGAVDKALFPVDAKQIDWTDYIQRVHLAGLNKYALGERKLYRLKSHQKSKKSAVA